MSSLPPEVFRLLSTQFGLITADQLAECGVSDRRRWNLVRSSTLLPVATNVYRFASHEVTFDQRCLAGCLAAGDGAVLSGPTCGRLYQLRKMPGDDIHMLARATINVPGIVGHRTNLLGPNDVTMRGPFRLLRPARLMCDLSAFLSDRDLDSVIEQALERGLVRLPVLRDVARPFLRSGRNGAARLSRVMTGRPGWDRPTESDLELRLMRAMADRGLAMTPQFRLVVGADQVVRLDLAEPSLRFAVEVDHATWHVGRASVRADKERDRTLMLIGWTVARVTDDDIDTRLGATVDQLLAIADRLRSAA